MAGLSAGKRKTGGKAGSRGAALCAGKVKRSARKTGAKPGARAMRVKRICKEIEDGTYETEGKLRIAISRLIDDVLARGPKSRD